MPPPLNVSLASTLLENERDQNQNHLWTTGIASLDAQLNDARIWRAGNVLGIGVAESIRDGLGDRSLTLEVITTHLLTKADDPPPPTQASAAYIVAPPAQSTATIRALHSVLSRRLVSQKQSTKRREQSHRANFALPTTSASTPTGDESAVHERATRMLASVSLLQHLDLAGLVESISEIAMRLSAQTEKGPRIIVVVQNVSQLMTATYRRSGLVGTAAVVANVLRQMRDLARTRGVFVVVEVDVQLARRGDVVLETAFAGDDGMELTLVPGGALGRIVAEALDGIVLVHDGLGRERGNMQVVVEVVKDRRGDGFGNWAVWDHG